MQKVRGGYIGYKRYKYIIIGYHRREELHHHSGGKSKPFRLVFKNSIFSVNIIIPSFQPSTAHRSHGLGMPCITAQKQSCFFLNYDNTYDIIVVD